MSINIILREQPGGDIVVRQMICDTCNAVLEERLGEERDRVGTTLYVRNWCKDCAKKQFPDGLLGMPVYTVQGPTIGNPNAISKVRIET